LTKRSLALAGLLGLLASQATAYKFIEFRSRTGDLLRLRWTTMPVTFFVSNRAPRDFTLQQMIDSTRASFQTWQDIPTSSITFQYGGTTGASPLTVFDGMSTIGFITDPDLQGTGILAATQPIVNTITGAIVEADIFFNNDFSWSVAAGGTPGRIDFVSVLTHEIGHFGGLDHSAVGVMQTRNQVRELLAGSAVMWPFAFPRGSVIGRTLTVDDTTAFSVTYPDGGFTAATGALAGRVTKNGRGLLAVSVIAFNPFTGETVGQFTNSTGNYTISGLRPGPYIVRVNAIVAPTGPDNFSFDESQVDLNFRDKLFAGRAEVSPGQTTDNINFEVSP